MIYAKKRKLKIFHLNGISANFCCFIIGDLSPLLPEPVTYDKYKTYRNRLTSVLRAAEKSYYANKLLNERDNLRKVWQTINKIIGKSSSSTSIKEIEQSGINITDSTKIAENFNRYFSNLGSSLAKLIAPSSCKPTDYLKVNTLDSLFYPLSLPLKLLTKLP